MNPLESRLASLRRRLRWQICWRGVCALAVLILGGAVIAGFADWLVDLPSFIRALVLVGLLAAAGVTAYRALIQPLRTRCDDLALALRIEEEFPELDDALASTVQFLEEPDSAAGSPVLRKAAIQRTLALTESHDFSKILRRRGQWWLAGAALVVVLAAGHFLYHYPSLSETAARRLTDPFGGHTWTRIALEETPRRVAQGQPFVVRGQIAGVIPAAARVEVNGVLKSEKLFAIKKDEYSPHTGALVAAIDMTQQKGKFRFRIYANDAVYPARPGAWHEVEVVPPPKFALLGGLPSPQIELRYPAYTDLPSPARLPPGSKYLDAIAGTHVTYRAAFDRPLDEAWIELRPENPVLRVAAMLAHLGHARPLAAAASLGSSHALWGRVNAHFETSQIIALRFVPAASGKYLLHVRDDHGIAKDFEADLHIRPDPVPTVQLERPASSMSVLPDAEIALKMSVSDEEFAVRAVYLEYRVRDAAGVLSETGKLPLYEHDTMGKVVPCLLAGLAASPVAGPDLRLRPKELHIAGKWALKNRFKEGEAVVVQIAADDFCDLFQGRPPGRSHEIELRIIGKSEIARILDDNLGKAQQELVRVQRMQEEALNAVKDLQKRKAKDKLNQKELDQLIEAEQLQKQIQERLGNRPEEGLRGELAKLEQWLKDNKLPSSEAADKVKTLKIELDRLVREEVPQIEPNLAEARRELTEGAKADPKNPGAKNKGPLDKAQKLQEQTKKSLDELAKFLDPWASMHQVTGETRELLNKQKDLQKDVEKLLDKSNDAQKAGKSDEEIRAELQRKAETQKELGDRAQKLLDMMKSAQDQRDKQGDKEGAEKLEKAKKVGDDEGLRDKMQEAAKNIKADKTNEAARQQHESAKSLEKMLAKLEDHKDDELDRLQKKHKQAAEVQDNLEKLAKDQDRLQKKARDINKIDDPEERAKELKKLAEEQEKLKNDAEKNARELARLQEEQAAKALNRAAQEMEKAVQRLEEGQNAEENQQEALDRVEDAQAKLEDFEEELTREQMAKIADKIKGLKERQDASLEASKEVHKKLTKNNQWTDGLVDTLRGQVMTQQGLKAETDSLKEKIKEAKVFAHVFDKAAQSMEDAGKAMDERRESGKERRYDEGQKKTLDKEEIADENRRAKEIEGLQAQASRRLERLLDALKQDPPEMAKDDAAGQDGGEQDGPKMRPGDGVPPIAQLKALRAEQLEVNEQTKEFAKQHPNTKNLTQPQRIELAELEALQRQLHDLFEEMTAPAKMGDMP